MTGVYFGDQRLTSDGFGKRKNEVAIQVIESGGFTHNITSG